MDNTSKSFLRWAGGKVNIVNHLIKYLPSGYQDHTYWEPFLGGGSLFFAIAPKRAILSDLNDHLIHCYEMVRDHPERVYYYLKQLSCHDSEDNYYKIRKQYNKSRYSIRQAARFIYLNKTSFNGIFRVNRNGDYNVPYGKKPVPAFPNLADLRKASGLLRKVKLFPASYEIALNGAQRNDFIYLDPPYPPLNGTSNFTHYTKERFGEDEQIKVANVAKTLDKNGCKVMISNASTRFIKELYGGWRINIIPVTRWITCKSIKHKVDELIITNYEVEESER